MVQFLTSLDQNGNISLASLETEMEKLLEYIAIFNPPGEENVLFLFHIHFPVTSLSGPFKIILVLLTSRFYKNESSCLLQEHLGYVHTAHSSGLFFRFNLSDWFFVLSFRMWQSHQLVQLVPSILIAVVVTNASAQCQEWEKKNELGKIQILWHINVWLYICIYSQKHFKYHWFASLTIPVNLPWYVRER